MLQHVVTTDAGEISSPALHDALVMGLVLTQADCLLMFVETVDHKKLSLAFNGVERLRADDFRQGNIILDVTVSMNSDIDAADVAYACGVDQKDDPFVLQTTEQLQRTGAVVVRVNPSYGCSLVCVCKQLLFGQGWGAPSV